MAKTTIPAITPQTHALVKFGSWNTTFLVPLEDASRIMVLMKDAIRVDNESLGNIELYIPKEEKQVTFAWTPASAIILRVGVHKTHIKNYIAVLKATAQLQGEDFDPSTMPFDEWFAASEAAKV